MREQARTRKVTVNVPADLLARAQKYTHKGITETIVEGLRKLDKKSKIEQLLELKGKVDFDLDLDYTRQ